MTCLFGGKDQSSLEHRPKLTSKRQLSKEKNQKSDNNSQTTGKEVTAQSSNPEHQTQEEIQQQGKNKRKRNTHHHHHPTISPPTLLGKPTKWQIGCPGTRTKTCTLYINISHKAVRHLPPGGPVRQFQQPQTEKKNMHHGDCTERNLRAGQPPSDVIPRTLRKTQRNHALCLVCPPVWKTQHGWGTRWIW